MCGNNQLTKWYCKIRLFNKCVKVDFLWILNLTGQFRHIISMSSGIFFKSVLNTLGTQCTVFRAYFIMKRRFAHALFCLGINIRDKVYSRSMQHIAANQQ